VRSARKKGYNNGASGAAALPASGMGNTAMASGRRPRLQSGRNSGIAEDAPRWADVSKSIAPFA
jgi:hypothetical protein